MDMPKVQVAQAFALPVLVSLLCGLFLINCGKQPKNRNDCLSEVTQELPERNKLRNRATILVNQPMLLVRIDSIVISSKILMVIIQLSLTVMADGKSLNWL